MPAMSMAGTYAANPSTGNFVLMSPFSGPKGSPFDKDTGTTTSTGALNTGIGYGSQTIIGAGITQPAAVRAGFNLDGIPGVTMPNRTNAPDARLTCIGGGRSGPATNGIAANNPYGVQPLLGFGFGGSRDAGAGPAFTGFLIRLVIAGQDTANGAVLTAGYTNRSGRTVLTALMNHGSSTTASAAIT